MNNARPDAASLYGLLAMPAPPTADAGETISTKAKETADRDVETFALEELIDRA